jgi:hypothetical protein
MKKWMVCGQAQQVGVRCGGVVGWQVSGIAVSVDGMVLFAIHSCSPSRTGGVYWVKTVGDEAVGLCEQAGGHLWRRGHPDTLFIEDSRSKIARQLRISQAMRGLCCSRLWQMRAGKKRGSDLGWSILGSKASFRGAET